MYVVHGRAGSARGGRRGAARRCGARAAGCIEYFSPLSAGVAPARRGAAPQILRPRLRVSRAPPRLGSATRRCGPRALVGRGRIPAAAAAATPGRCRVAATDGAGHACCCLRQPCNGSRWGSGESAGTPSRAVAQRPPRPLRRGPRCRALQMASAGRPSSVWLRGCAASARS